jgi:hypothetical protein
MWRERKKFQVAQLPFFCFHRKRHQVYREIVKKCIPVSEWSMTVALYNVFVSVLTPKPSLLEDYSKRATGTLHRVHSYIYFALMKSH